MTFVTASARSRQTWGWRASKKLPGRVEFGFQCFQIVNSYDASINCYQSFGLKAGEISGNQLADRSDLRRQFLVADRQNDFHSPSRALAFGSAKAQEERSQPMPHGCERKFLDDSHELSQPGTNHAQNLKSNSRMSQAECLKILLTDEQQRRVVDCGHRGRVVSSIEDRKLCDRAARPIDTENLFASTSRTLEDADVS